MPTQPIRAQGGWAWGMPGYLSGGVRTSRSGGGAEVQRQRLIWGRGEEVNGRGCVGGRGRAGGRGLANGRGPEGRGCLSRLQPDSVSLGATCGARRQDEATKGRLRLTLEEGPTRDQKAGGLENGECL